MVRHCAWCGRFLPRDAEPVTGYNVRGERVDQLLCAQECGPGWQELSARNLARLADPPD